MESHAQRVKRARVLCMGHPAYLRGKQSFMHVRAPLGSRKGRPSFPKAVCRSDRAANPSRASQGAFNRIWERRSFRNEPNVCPTVTRFDPTLGTDAYSGTKVTATT